MPHREHLCSHENKVDDEREGICVCTDCGLVLEEKLFLPGYNEKTCFETLQCVTSTQKELEKKEEIKELLHRINLPDVFSFQVSKKSLQKQNSKKSVPFLLYQSLNENGCPISMKEISAVSGMANNKIYKNQEKNEIIIIKPELMLEKYCNMLNLDFNAYSVIKKQISSHSKTGHTPLTIIGANIYLYIKNNNLKTSMKLVAKTLNISCISIQRYLKQIKF